MMLCWNQMRNLNNFTCQIDIHPLKDNQQMESNPLFSVLIPNYNNATFLMDAVNSVYKQTYTNWEIIIVDDCSTDNSKELYKQLVEDKRISIFYNPKNGGCGYTKHECAIHANGTYCGYLDPDDVLLPNAIEVVLDKLLANPNAVLCMSRHYHCKSNLEIVAESRPLVLEKGESYFEHKNYQAEHFAGFKKEAYMATGGINPSYRMAADADLFFKLEEVGELVISHEITYMYRHHANSVLAQDWTKGFYWNLIARHATCIRRGLPVEDYSYSDFLSFLSQSKYQSKAYRIGKAILQPFMFLKRTHYGTLSTDRHNLGT